MEWEGLINGWAPLECPVENSIRLKSLIADKWSFLNRLLMYCNNTEDARGFNQWKQAGRYIIKGSHAFYILAPMFKKVIDKKTSIQRGFDLSVC